MFELNNFDAIKISLASPKEIREWSNGEVTKAETLNYRTQKPEKDGLFCEKIFGPSKNYECHCGKYKRPRYKGVTCDKCGVLVTTSNVRRERMGHIELACPVSHIWFFKINPSKIGLTLDVKTSEIEQVLYYVSYIIIDPGTTDFEKKQVISDKEYREAKEKYGNDSFKAGMGAEAVKELLKEVNLKKEIEEISEEMKDARETKKLLLGKRKKILENFYKSNNKPEWMIMDTIPVLPPDLRPMVQLDGGRFATNDLNDLYRRVLNRNIRLKKIMKLGAPEVIVRNEKRMLQEAVDALLDNGRRGKIVTGGAQNRQLKSLTESLKGKQGRFRQNLLGKRVDYSGRAVIVIGPELKIYQCGIPKQMALELFKPFIIQKLLKMNDSYNIKSARRIVEYEKPVVWDILEEIIKDHPVLLNRQPTLHKLGIQAFEPIIVEGNSIRLHPLVCAGFNADFDGDQMSVHVPLSVEARSEARLLMLASNNIVKPSDGEPIVTPQQDIVLGTYYLTISKPGSLGEGKSFSSESEAIAAYQLGKIALQSEIYVKKESYINEKKVSKRIKTTVGKIIFNEVIPQDIGIIDRKDEESALLYEIDYPVGKKELSKIVALIYEKYGSTKTAKILDKVKELGYKYSTIGGITMSVYDMKTPKERQSIIEETQKLVDTNDKNYRRGLITLSEKIDKNIELWDDATAKVSKAVQENLDTFNPIKMIADSKARTNPSQLNQVCGMRGITSVTSAQKIDIPIKNNYRSGLTPIDYFISARGGRKGLADKALGTSKAGYLTRRLVEIAQEVMVTTEDCFADKNQQIKGMEVKSIIIDSTPVVSLEKRIIGRYASEDIIDKESGEIIVSKNNMISKQDALNIVSRGIESVFIRTNLTCSEERGVCAKCYGKDMSNSKTVDLGEAVGVIAAQAIGEPGTQLTMNNFHTGGISSGSVDITAGLPRVEELFEARTPKGTAIISLVSGEVLEINNVGKLKQIIIKTDKGEVEYTPDYGKTIIVKVGDKINPGDPLTSGPIDPKELLHTQGVQSVQKYIMNEVLSVYSKQSVEVNPKHLEIVIKQMLTKVQIIDSGETDLLIGTYVDLKEYDKENNKAMTEGKMPATAKRVVLGLQKASINKESFLSAASFQETSRVLTEAAIEGKTDNLLGLKENLLIGRLIPAGTGVKKFRKVLPKVMDKDFNPYDES